MSVWSLISELRADAADWMGRLGGAFAYNRGGVNLKRLDYFATDSGLAHRVTWIVPQDGLSKGWTTDTDTEKDTTSEIDSKGGLLGLNVEGMLLKGGGSARQHGGAWLWPVANASEFAWSQPRPPGKHKVEALHVLTATEVTPIEWELDPFDKDWSRPSIVQVQVSRDGAHYNARMHASWLIYVPGAPCPPSSEVGKQKGYDVSTLELYREAICDYDSGGSSISKIMNRLAYFWVRLKDGDSKITGDEGDKTLAALQLLKTSMSTAGMLVLTGENEAGWSGPSISGVRDAMAALAERISGVEGIALSILIGQPTGGLSDDSKASQRAYNSLLQRWRRHVAGPVLLELYDMVLGPDSTRRIVWPDAETPSDIDLAKASDIRAGRDLKLISQGVISSEESRKRFDGEGESDLPVVDDGTAPVDAPPPTEEAGGDPPVEAPDADGPQIGELSLAIQRLIGAGDADLVNELRRAITANLGIEYPGPIDVAPPAEPGPRADAAGSKAFISVPLSPAALEQWAAVRAAVEKILGPLEEPGGDKPHVTALFMGEVEEDDLPEVVEGVGEVAGDTVAFRYSMRRVASFEPTDGSAGRTPIIGQLESWGFDELNEALMRRLQGIGKIKGKRHKRFVAHVTIGILDRAVTPEERGALLEMKVELEGAAVSIDLAFGKSIVETYPLPAIRTDTEDDE